MEIESPYKLDMVSVRLVHDPPLLSDHKIKTAEDAVQVIGELLGEMDREVICIINLRSDGTPINGHIASVGAINQAITTPREMLKAAILSNAASMIMLHCHPSGSVVPSMEDVKLTARMIEIGSLIGIPVVDHIIVGGDTKDYFSLRSREMLSFPDKNYQTDYRFLEFEGRNDEMHVVNEKENTAMRRKKGIR